MEIHRYLIRLRSGLVFNKQMGTENKRSPVVHVVHDGVCNESENLKTKARTQWIWRSRYEPVPEMPVIWPNVPDVMLDDGLPNTGWLRRLAACSRYSSRVAPNGERTEQREVEVPRSDRSVVRRLCRRQKWIPNLGVNSTSWIAET